MPLQADNSRMEQGNSLQDVSKEDGANSLTVVRFSRLHSMTVAPWQVRIVQVLERIEEDDEQGEDLDSPKLGREADQSTATTNSHSCSTEANGASVTLERPRLPSQAATEKRDATAAFATASTSRVAPIATTSQAEESHDSMVLSLDGAEKYLVRSAIGSGSFGTVHRAIRMSDSQEVAIKFPHGCSINVVKQELDALEAFRKAGNCDYIVRFLDAGYRAELPENDRHIISFRCIVLELCDTDLSSFISQHNLPSAVRFVFSYQLATALSCLHGLGFCHDDIKAENILVSFEQGALKLTDFGVSRRFFPEGISVDGTSELDKTAPQICLKEIEVLMHADIHEYVAVVMQLWRGLSFDQENTMELLEEKVQSLGPTHGRIFHNVAMALGFSGNVNRRLERCRQDIKEMSTSGELQLSIREVAREFLTWSFKQPARVDRNEEPLFGTEIPEVMVDSCLMLCYCFEGHEEVSADAVAKNLKSVIPTEMFKECENFFRRLHRQASQPETMSSTSQSLSTP